MTNAPTTPALSTPVDTGLACLVMLARFHQIAIDPGYLEISADGNWLQGQYGNGATDEVEMVVLQRSS